MLREAVEQAAAAFFHQEYDRTRISPQEQDKFERYCSANSHLEKWAKIIAAPEENEWTSGSNGKPIRVNPSNRWWSDIFRRDADLIKIDVKNAIEDDEIVSIRQRTEARKAIEAASWKRLRQYLWEGRLTGYCFYANGQLLKLDATGWGGTWADGMHERVASEAKEIGTLIINEFELEAVLSGKQPVADLRAAQSSQTKEGDLEISVNGTKKSDGPPTKCAPVRIVAKLDIEAVYREWIAQHEDQTPPSRDDDRKYMQGRFPQMPRDRIRELRKELAPEEWLRPGRRKANGRRKLAKKS